MILGMKVLQSGLGLRRRCRYRTFVPSFTDAKMVAKLVEQPGSTQCLKLLGSFEPAFPQNMEMWHAPTKPASWRYMPLFGDAN